MSVTRRNRTREGRRERRAGERVDPEVARVTQPVHDLPAYEMVSEEGIEKLQACTLEVLSDIGIDFYDDEAQSILKAHGVRMEGDTAFFDREMVAEYLALAPSQFQQRSRNEQRWVTVGGNNVCFAPVYGPPFVTSRDRGRREATLQDFQNFVKMAYSTPYLHHSGGTIVEPTDEPVHTRHLDMVYSHIKYSDKPFMGSVTSAVNAADSVRLAELLYGEDEIRETPGLLSLINISSPRRLDDRMLGAMKVYAKAKQALMITPFVFSGAMGPAAVAGTVVQINAEALAGIIFTQMVNPGTPCVFGAFQTNIDLQSGAPVFGSPESQIALFTLGQLARRHGLPYRSGGMFSSAKIPDAQAAYESLMVMLPAILGKVHFILHSAGWLEGGLTAGYEKFVLDLEILGMFHTFFKGLDMSENGLAMESLRTVPPDGHHLGTPHTLANFRSAFFRSELFDYNSYEQWAEEGARDVYTRAGETYKRMLKEYQPPALDPGIDDALKEFVERRKQEIEPEY